MSPSLASSSSLLPQQGFLESPPKSTTRALTLVSWFALGETQTKTATNPERSIGYHKDTEYLMVFNVLRENSYVWQGVWERTGETYIESFKK